MTEQGIPKKGQRDRSLEQAWRQHITENLRIAIPDLKAMKVLVKLERKNGQNIQTEAKKKMHIYG